MATALTYMDKEIIFLLNIIIAPLIIHYVNKVDEK